MTRFCVENTVDEDLVEMQERKQEEIDGIMENGGTTSKKLTTKELMRLFGPLEEDDEGTPFILVPDAPTLPRIVPGGDDESFQDSP